jgi:thiosulfate/3-mercaptopyruvate sulfurtransferase
MTQHPAYTTLISADQLQQLGASGQPFMVFDCSFDLMNPQAGEAMYREAHIPGAVYAHLDTALSDKLNDKLSDKLSDKSKLPTDAAQLPDNERPASGGRHPLPAREKFAAWLGSVGFGNGMQAVVYDRQGANYCGRLWWMLKWVGHENVAVLDGGLQAWQALSGRGSDAVSGATSSAMESARTPSNFRLAPAVANLVTTNTIADNLGRPIQTVVDARGAPRFRGEVEPLDPVAGHIPGALNRPFNQNIGADGKFKPAAALKVEFEALLAGRDPATVVHHCGSGVSAVPNILSMEIAGLGRTALYAGSWSEWCSDPSRPVAQG